MKLILLCCVFLVCLSQAQSKYVYLEDEFNASLKAWKDLNSKAYTYVVVTTSSKDTTGRTTIKVRNGQVVARKYVERTTFYYPGEVVKSWSETTPETIGTHEGYPAAYTLDELYDYCLDSILTQNQNPANQDPKDPAYFAKLDVDANGLISRCAYYRSHGFSGITLNVDSIRYC